MFYCGNYKMKLLRIKVMYSSNIIKIRQINIVENIVDIFKFILVVQVGGSCNKFFININ